MAMFSGEDKRAKIIVLLTMCFALFMVMLDNTVVNVALPTISRELGAGVSGLQWIVDGYALAVACLLLTGGTLGDRYGHKKTFLAGLAIFTAASLMSGLSTTTGMLIAFRTLQGVGGALLLPGTLSIITITFPPQERAQAIGIWAGVSGIALALGPTLGGWFVEHLGWESVFFLNVPIGLIGFFVAMKVVHERGPHGTRKLDIPGLALGTAGLFGITYGLIESNAKGWGDPAILIALIGGAALIVAFLLYERRAAEPMMPLSFFKLRAFSAGNTVAFSISLGMFATFFFVSLYMQIIRQYTPFQAGLSFLPLTGMIILVAPWAGKLAQQVGSRLPMTIGLTMDATGLFLLSWVKADTSYWLIAPVFVVMGAGMALTMAPMTAAVMNAVGPKRAGLGSAMTNTSREVGGVFGIALLGTILTSVMKSSISPALAAIGGLSAQSRGIVAASAGHLQIPQDVLATLSPGQRGLVFNAFTDAFLKGFHVAVLVAAVIIAVAAVVANRFIPSGAPVADHQGASGGAAEPAEPAEPIGV